MALKTAANKAWMDTRIKEDQITRYAAGGDFIKKSAIKKELAQAAPPGPEQIDDILAKSLSIESLSLDETAALLRVSDPHILEKMRHTGLLVKKKVYDNRIVAFAPLYLANYCVNDCLYCAFRRSNDKIQRRVLSLAEVEAETGVLAGEVGHRRLIVVFGEHELNDVAYMADAIKTIYGVGRKVKVGSGQIRRVNVNAPPMPIEELARLRDAGIGTYQVFQETYHRPTYEAVHPRATVKGNYLWRLYAIHRAFEAGIDDVGLGALFGLYDWRYEVMGLVAHNRELEEKFGVGAHTISFPRLEPAFNTPFTKNPQYKVSDDDFKRLITVIRLAVPHTGLIITARENGRMRRESIELGITQTDASTKIGIGSYSEHAHDQNGLRQQFILDDTRSLDEVVREFAAMGYISSFCTAGYRCGRTGECIMKLLRSGKEGKFCKLNAILTFREWLDDFASGETKVIAEPLIVKEIEEVRRTLPEMLSHFMEYYDRIKKGERDLYF